MNLGYDYRAEKSVNITCIVLGEKLSEWPERRLLGGGCRHGSSEWRCLPPKDRTKKLLSHTTGHRGKMFL
jgi:hypothetical protein